MPKLPGINHLRAIKALEKAGFHIDRHGKHVFMSKGPLRVVIPRNNLWMLTQWQRSFVTLA
jgi:predicted RNA binding protein YcfA (HicA-like mRNA interferase family)